MIGTPRIGRSLAAACLLLATMSGSVRCARLDYGEAAYRDASYASACEASPDAGKDEVVTIDNPSIVGWLASDEPSLSYPVVQPREGIPRTWYLNHDVWGNASELGCPYLDVRSEADGSHLLVYGHRIVGTNYMFSPLADAYDPEVFRTLGAMRWCSKDGRELLCTPLCAMRVRATYQPIQRFDFDDTESLRRWLRRIADSAPATSCTAGASIASSTRAVTLVTCSGNLIGSDWRTLVVYTAG